MNSKATTTSSDIDPPETPVEQSYQCPGERYTISRAIHLARMGDSYPGCAECRFRTDTGSLSKARVRQLTVVWNRQNERELVCPEAIAGRYGENLDPRTAWTWGAAFGARVTQLSNSKPIRVAIGNDGRGLSAELVQSVGAGVRWTGADAIDCGETTAPGLAVARRSLATDGGLFVGNPLGLVQTAGIRFWGPGGRLWSSPGELEVVRQMTAEGIDRPRRKSGSINRQPLHASYADTFREAFHALRPVKFVLDTSCRLIVRDLSMLLESVACRMLPSRRDAADARPLASSASTPKTIGNQVRDESANFGAWIDGDGESCLVWNEQGSLIPGELLLLALLDGDKESPLRNVVLEAGAAPEAAGKFKQRGFSVKSAGATREAMHDRLSKMSPANGGGPSGRHWLGPSAAGPDALLTLTRLLQLLSASDRPLSQVISELLADRAASG